MQTTSIPTRVLARTTTSLRPLPLEVVARPAGVCSPAPRHISGIALAVIAITDLQDLDPSSARPRPALAQLNISLTQLRYDLLWCKTLHTKSPSDHMVVKDSHSTWISFRGAGQTRRSLHRRTLRTTRFSSAGRGPTEMSTSSTPSTSSRSRFPRGCGRYHAYPMLIPP